MDDQPVEIGRHGPEAGQGWSERAALDPLAAVIDPADVRGGKNRLIHRMHLRALSKNIGDVKGKEVLVGCGTGRVSAWLVERGAAVVAVDASGIDPSIVDGGESALLVPVRDAAALAAAIAELGAEPERRRQLAGRAREVVQREGDFDRELHRAVHLYEELAAVGARPRHGGPDGSPGGGNS
jgi:hypothetical protein